MIRGRKPNSKRAGAMDHSQHFLLCTSVPQDRPQKLHSARHSAPRAGRRSLTICNLWTSRIHHAKVSHGKCSAVPVLCCLAPSPMHVTSLRSSGVSHHDVDAVWIRTYLCLRCTVHKPTVQNQIPRCCFTWDIILPCVTCLLLLRFYHDVSV